MLRILENIENLEEPNEDIAKNILEQLERLDKQYENKKSPQKDHEDLHSKRRFPLKFNSLNKK